MIEIAGVGQYGCGKVLAELKAEREQIEEAILNLSDMLGAVARVLEGPLVGWPRHQGRGAVAGRQDQTIRVHNLLPLLLRPPGLPAALTGLFLNGIWRKREVIAWLSRRLPK